MAPCFDWVQERRYQMTAKDTPVLIFANKLVDLFINCIFFHSLWLKPNLLTFGGVVLNKVGKNNNINDEKNILN